MTPKVMRANQPTYELSMMMSTRTNSTNVGKILNNRNCKRKLMPLVPRSTDRRTPPVCLKV